jgi:hypothetical protein
MENYIPTILLLDKIILKKNQKENKNVKFYIGIRHHSSIELLIDKLINILITYLNINIFICVSTNEDLMDKIKLNNNDLINKCNYINFIKPKNIIWGSCEQVMITLKKNYNVNFEYFIYHTESEYYCKQINNTDIEKYDYKNTNKITIDYESEDIYNHVYNNNKYITKEILFNHIDRLINIGSWPWIYPYEEDIKYFYEEWIWPKFKENKLLLDIFIKNNILPIKSQVNGLILNKEMTIELYDFYIKNIKPIEDTYIFTPLDELKHVEYPFNEIIIPSFIINKYNVCLKFITKSWWNMNSKTIINTHKNCKENYLCVKRIDNDYNDYLLFIHDIYMKPVINSII